MAITSFARETGQPMQDDLVRLAQRGDSSAFGRLIQGRLSRLHASAVLIVRDAELGNDAVQDALVEAWRDIPGLRDPARLDAWLHRLLIRSCYRVARSHRRRRVLEIPIAFDSDAVSPARDLDSVVDRQDLERAFSRLSPEHRAILVLAYYADLPLVDVAAALDIPLGTAKSRLSRATNAFRAASAADARPALPSKGRIP